MTAAVGLYQRLGLSPPWLPATTPTPLVIYGAASAVGAFALQFALKSNIHPLICVAGRGASFVESFIDRSKGDTVVDYRSGDEAVVKGIRDALQGKKLQYAYDAVSEKGSYQNITQVLEPNGKITLVLPEKNITQVLEPNGEITLVLPENKYENIPATVEQSITKVGAAHDDGKDFGFVFFRLIGKGLADGWFKPHPHEVRKGGLAGIEGALSDLLEGKASAVKYVFRIADTVGVEKSSL
ncbi:hypothetical protein P152DRAFT_455728 [Eremomyces bilateralis CBS 781.70]|uniref:NAD(P)-binding protein n=1 Tax=Eremomyces bilateralis CBS 781.70 TaxID=1392243 RepID=A0A6G1G9I6_9PEZI|nr:uncharacterized protein P152DRAFT_455728 [Eremomyces bilateralis CBS 781.70]KAF1814683.1 hypothetical protein P152DRAFT_455728 [Eremomyces bilateralis CBS 781.70]